MNISSIFLACLSRFICLDQWRPLRGAPNLSWGVHELVLFCLWFRWKQLWQRDGGVSGDMVTPRHASSYCTLHHIHANSFNAKCVKYWKCFIHTHPSNVMQRFSKHKLSNFKFSLPHSGVLGINEGGKKSHLHTSTHARTHTGHPYFVFYAGVWYFHH